jgi:hypothetical protein
MYIKYKNIEKYFGLSMKSNYKSALLRQLCPVPGSALSLQCALHRTVPISY